MSFTTDEINTQPACWAAAAALARGVAGSLPARGERVAVVGCGTSYNMAQAYARLREDAGEGLTDAMPASEALYDRPYDRFVFLSRSGTTSEVLKALDGVPKGVTITAITASANSPLAGAVPSAVVLDFADERSVVQTRFPTTVLVLLRASLGHNTKALVDAAKRAVEEPLPEQAQAASRFTFLGQRWTVGLANEAALKLREAAQMWTESYSALEVRHGPISVLDENFVVWCFGPMPAGLEEDLAATGTGLVVSNLDPLADLIRVQRLAVALATSCGLDPDRPRNLVRSVILAGS